jgi:cell division transport system permease protein
MFLLSFARVIKMSFQDIYRNIWLSIVTITILILALFSINLLLIVQVIGENAVSAVKERIDINLYLKTDATDEQIEALRAKLTNLNGVKEVAYISKSMALDTFREKHKDNTDILDVLKELGKNPLSPALIVKPKDVDNFETLTANIKKIDSVIIDSQDFTNHKLLLDKINGITKKISEAGLIVSGIFVLTMLLVVYNAIRVAIYTHRREITIMKLVGASNWFIYMPFLIASLIYTMIGLLVCLSILYLFMNLLQPYLEAFFIGYNINIISYFNQNYFRIFGLEFLAVAFINMFASLVAAKKYSKV